MESQWADLVPGLRPLCHHGACSQRAAAPSCVYRVSRGQGQAFRELRWPCALVTGPRQKGFHSEVHLWSSANSVPTCASEHRGKGCFLGSHFLVSCRCGSTARGWHTAGATHTLTVFQGEAAALPDAGHGLGCALPAGHPPGHLRLRVSETMAARVIFCVLSESRACNRAAPGSGVPASCQCWPLARA